MTRIRLIVAALFAALALSACDMGPIFDPEKAEAERLAALPAKVPVDRIETLELGRLYDGYVLTAFGLAPGAGYYQPELRIRYDGRPAADGFYEYDFIVRPPADAAALAGAPEAARRMRADVTMPVAMLRGARGVRVWSSRDSIEGRF